MTVSRFFVSREYVTQYWPTYLYMMPTHCLRCLLPVLIYAFKLMYKFFPYYLTTLLRVGQVWCHFKHLSHILKILVTWLRVCGVLKITTELRPCWSHVISILRKRGTMRRWRKWQPSAFILFIPQSIYIHMTEKPLNSPACKTTRIHWMPTRIHVYVSASFTY